jgi:hypothetical protein
MPQDGGDTTSSVGVELMKELIKNLVIMNRGMELNRDLLIEIRDMMQVSTDVQKALYEAEDAVASELSVWGRAMEILADVRDTKKHLSLADVVSAYASADDELGEDERGEEDPRVEAGA